jgi:hypothetical protein
MGGLTFETKGEIIDLGEQIAVSPAALDVVLAPCAFIHPRS